ncbi:LysM peptidoglycan-binding domain-containing protein [Halalkalibacter akibai]|uniref:Gamma-D-glutamyl-L-diamino acid endopeptidase n=1 Tax=Halalkalibacter akibai (strain ATCC 43226 / DSM 21942 / CIP 109018 / JCM 9157 / 1139) TaxID=1236973 RepID=W4QZB3_HALA3|nr:LysM domain-containing protein [Halalkalibacter akibai]GAE37008.1 gamma-D-glutamyl-L-diamino acid endopeptidase [Halalkalibacter akibai JCM 9157]
MNILVRAGDSLWYYSQIFSLPLRQLIEANQSLASNQLQIGKEVSVPGYILVPYEIQTGDSLWDISRKLRMPLDRLLLVNQQLNPATLKAGYTIQVPQRIHEQ